MSKIVFTGGGTGGHVFPIIAVDREIKRKVPEGKIKFYYVGAKDDFSHVFLPQEGIKTIFIWSGKFRRYFNIVSFFQNIFDIFVRIPIGFVQSFFILFFLMPDVIFSKGGYGSLGTVIAGWLLGIPIFMHESDISPGLANRICSNFSSKIFISFPPKETDYFPLKKMIYVGNPIREELLKGTKESAKSAFELHSDKPVLVILGGSQGSERINEIIMGVLPEMVADFEVIHQAGDRNIQQVKKEADAFLKPEIKKYYHLFPFLSESQLKDAYAAADFIVARSGAGTIFEVAAVGKPSILVPLPESAQNHQLKNAYNFARSEGCLVLEEGNLTPHFLLKKIKDAFLSGKVKTMAQKAKDFAKPDAADMIARYLLEYL
ncbi:MAG: UDP-N-acetylglucosamine--N-acetylmuramyl-(pentapeptide) pyrophosphoryl-undecaprenol N-acetylglucosamine transferase [Candidatus Paceibacterota bacterium]|jgi:UDP-N-acetylglucosamine--N-acetylmuramyl-(pentapeptide) pyrophosphoryl-undecaprenol N-acetylglucosamine transferase